MDWKTGWRKFFENLASPSGQTSERRSAQSCSEANFEARRIEEAAKQQTLKDVRRCGIPASTRCAFGAAITVGAVDLPEFIGYLLIAAGAIDALVMPIVLARTWKTPS